MTLDEMYATPGFYEISTPGLLLQNKYFVVEVDNKGVCHQLNPKGERDGELSRDGWNETPLFIKIVAST